MTPDEVAELIILRYQTNKGAVDLNLRKDIINALTQRNIELAKSYSSAWERANYLEELIFNAMVDDKNMKPLIEETIKIYNKRIKTYRLGLKNEKPNPLH